MDHDNRDCFRFAALQSETGEALLEQYGIDRAVTDSIVLIENGQAYTHSTAALRIGRSLGGIWAMGYVFMIVPKFLRDAVYRLIASNRYRMFGKTDTCRIPTPEEANKFI